MAPWKNEPVPEATGSPAHTKSKPTGCYIFLHVFVIIMNVIAIITITIASGYTIYVPIVKNSGIVFSSSSNAIGMLHFEVSNMEVWHAALCSVGVAALVCSTLLPVKAPWAKWVHGIMGLLGTLLIIIGILIQLLINRNSGSFFVKNVRSIHSNYGLASGLFMIVVVVLGFLLLGGATCWSDIFMDIIHHLCGVISCILAACSFGFAIKQPWSWFHYISTKKERTMLYVLIIYTIVWCAIVGTVKFIMKLRKPS